MNEKSVIKDYSTFMLKMGILFNLLLFFNVAQAQIFYDETSSYLVNSIEGGATWTKSASGDFVYNNNGTISSQRALVYSTDAYQSEDGFKLTVEYTTGSIEDNESHNFSFGLISNETNLSTYTGFNPFKAESSVYSIGANLTTDEDTTARGLNFTNVIERTNLDESGTRAQFKAGTLVKVTIEIAKGGYWCYRINGVYEDSGVLVEGIDLTKSYHVAVYGQDDNGDGKSIQSIKLEKGYANGERAQGLRGTWNGGLVVEQVKDFKTLDVMGYSFTHGATQAPFHKAPQKLLESLWQGDVDGNGDPINLVVPLWGDLSLDEPEYDPYLERILEIKSKGFKFQAYMNCQNFMGNVAESYDVVVERWKTYCDTTPEVQDFINSQPFHTGVWNRTTQQYEDASEAHPDRKYMFCYVEYILKDYALRYGKYIDKWIFDSGGDISSRGDNATSGILEEQRLYQAYANAVHAGNPDIPIAFNNSRSTVRYGSYPFAHAVHFDDFTFGHAFGGNNNHAEKVNGNQFNLNYRHVSRMMETNGYVHDGGNWAWDDKIVGNFHSKLSTTAWTTGPNQAWEEADFLQWNLEALQAGGSMTWDGSTYVVAGETVLRPWAYDLLKALDDHLSKMQNPENPNWSKAYTVLPEATICKPYYHVLVEGTDFWDPEDDEITELSIVAEGPSWLDISEDPLTPGNWILSGIPSESSAVLLEFELQAIDSEGNIGKRKVELQVNEVNSMVVNPGNGSPVWKSDVIEVSAAKHKEFTLDLNRCTDFEDFDGDHLTISLVNEESWLSLIEVSTDIWELSGVVECSGENNVELALTDGTNTANTTVQINVTDAQFLEMENNSINGGANWNTPNEVDETPEYLYANTGRNFNYRSLLYSKESFQSDSGLRLKIKYKTGNVEDTGGHNFSFGLIRSDTDVATYAGFNPFRVDTGVYSIGVNLTQDQEPEKRGLNFANGMSAISLDESGTVIEFATGVSTEVIIEVTKNGVWAYSINGVVEASGVIDEGFDLTKSYYVGIYGQDDNGGGKSIQEISLSACFDDSLLAVEEQELVASNVEIYPNPVETTFKIDNQEGAKIEVYNVFGSLHITEEITSNSHTINAENLTPGIYIVRVIRDAKTANYKIIKQ
ncbi:T9SS type A sorting domain-containing protein [Wenyingzhuangia sp. 2_MG-2023]|uniref:T9SS type A sorting domain-containing protein n=1 Tax=Wenyingzhuangia sp. 2_MG-2023 TaxID=3062639 RepID=UPI0026E15F5A|nr:T9SS type A sorting domain-containing protein [Wenyingzhuangia sp. 2_MG-2023]MDO6739329.1 T9SS type A sorting domain-containing protein [Wenyingzhuangia sp. 2_MG-2023]